MTAAAQLGRLTPPDEVLTAMYGHCGTCNAPLGPRVVVEPSGVVFVSSSCRENPKH